MKFYCTLILHILCLLIQLNNAQKSSLCNPTERLSDNIRSNPLIISGRILSQEDNSAVVLVLKTVKGLDIISNLKKASQSNDYHLLLIDNVQQFKGCHNRLKVNEDYIIFLRSNPKPNTFRLMQYAPFADGSFEQKISKILNGGFSRQVQREDPCAKMDCQFGAHCKIWPGEKPRAVCYCPNSVCSPSQDQGHICGSDGVLYESPCEMQRQQCLMQRIITVSHMRVCDYNADRQQPTEEEAQRDPGRDWSRSRGCDTHVCPPYSQCKEFPHPHCKCSDERCSPNSPAICGTDDITYTNICEMKKVSCKSNRHITQQHVGRCDLCKLTECQFHAVCRMTEDGTDKTCMCEDPTIACAYQPRLELCASDGVTYQSQCHMNIIMCRQKLLLTVQYKGACKSRQIQPSTYPKRNPCLSEVCGMHEQCRVDVNGRGICICPDLCPSIVQPICGNDQRSYESVCHLQKSACKTKKTLWVIHNGICSEEPRCQEQGYQCSAHQICRSDLMQQTRCVCGSCPDTGLGEQVCGNEGKTHRSECHLRAAACNRNIVDLAVLHKGACDACRQKKCSFYAICQMNRFGEPQCICPTDCEYERKPVCGSDGRTYESECFLKVKSCADKRLIDVVSREPCKKCLQDCPMGQMCRDGRCVCTDKCSKMALRVCGSDGQYYQNECELKKQACEQRKTIHIDDSESSCISRQYISDDNRGTINRNRQKCYPECLLGEMCKAGTCVCTDQCPISQRQVCGSDGQYYLNECELKKQACVKRHNVNIDITEASCTNSQLTSDDNSFDFHGKELGFSKDSYAKLFWSGDAGKYLLINMTLTTYNENGIILFGSDLSRSDDFVSIIIKDGHLIFSFDLGSGPLTIKSKSILQLGKSHNIIAERFERYARLVVDEMDSQYGTSPAFMTSLDTGSSFIIGQPKGLKTNINYQTGSLVNGFIGCLASLLVKAGEEVTDFFMEASRNRVLESLNLRQTCSSNSPEKEVVFPKFYSPTGFRSIPRGYCSSSNPCKNGGQCKEISRDIYNCLCAPGFQGHNCEEEVTPTWKFQGTSFVIYPTETLQLRRRLKLEIRFLPTSGNGQLAFISEAHPQSPGFISVFLRNNHVEVICRTPIGFTTLVSPEMVQIGKWNQLIVLKATKYIYLNLNQTPNPQKKRLIPESLSNISSYIRRKIAQFRITNQPLFFGGVDEVIYNQFLAVVNLKPEFQGAIQRITVNGNKLQLRNDYQMLNNVTQWQGPPCGPLHNPCKSSDPEKSFCIPEMDQAKCFCNPNQEHLCFKNFMQQDNPAITNFNRKFEGKSIAKFTAVKQNRIKTAEKNNIRLTFKTGITNGMILFMKKGNTVSKNFFVIAIRNSVIEVAINLGGPHGIIRVTSNRKVSDNKWHNVQVIRNQRNVVLLVDNRMFRAKMLEDNEHNLLHTDGWLWLGGPRKPVNGFPWEYNTKFSGCISELYVNEVAYNLVNDARKNFGPILKC